MEAPVFNPNEANPNLVFVTTTNPNPQLSHRRKPINLPATFDILDAEGNVEWKELWDENRRPMGLTLPTQFDRRKEVDAHNLEAVKAWIAAGKGYAQFIHIVDRVEQAVTSSHNLVVATELQGRLVGLFKSGDHETLAALLRRHEGTVKGMTAEEVFNALHALAAEQPDKLQRWMGSDFDPVYFLLDQSVDAGVMMREGESYYLATDPDNLIASSTRQMVKYLHDHPSFMAALRQRLEEPDEATEYPATRNFTQRAAPRHLSRVAAELARQEEEATQPEEESQPSAPKAVIDLETVFEAGVGAQLIRRVNGLHWRLPDGQQNTKGKLLEFLGDARNEATLLGLQEMIEASAG